MKGLTFRLHFWNLQKIWFKRSIDLSSVWLCRSCNIGWVTSVGGVIWDIHQRQKSSYNKGLFLLWVWHWNDWKVHYTVTVVFVDALGFTMSQIAFAQLFQKERIHQYTICHPGYRWIIWQKYIKPLRPMPSYFCHIIIHL